MRHIRAKRGFGETIREGSDDKPWLHQHTELAPRDLDFEKELLARRTEVLEEWERLPSQEENLDIPRVTTFLAELGMEYRSAKIMDRRSYRRLNRKTYGVLVGKLQNSAVARYDGYHDFIVLERNYADEDLNGTYSTEGIMVHEQIHANAGYADMVYSTDFTLMGLMRNKQGAVARTGFGTNFPSRGTFFEEGFASLCQGMYVGRRLRENRIDPAEIVETPSPSFKPLKIPRKYVAWSNPHAAAGLRSRNLFSLGNELCTDYSSVAGYGMELLIGQRPELFECLVSARHSVESLRKLPRLLNAIEPGLYSTLAELGYKDSLKGLSKIKDILS